MTFTRLAMAALCFTTIACSTGPAMDQDQLVGGSSLTDVSVALPTKDQLPDSLLEKKLYYCFSIQEFDGIVYAPTERKLPCSVPASSATFSSEGDYQQNIKLEKSLDATASYVVSLAVGLKVNQTIDTESVHYLGSSTVTPADMTGKQKLSLALTMKKIGEGEGDDVITTNTSLDLEVTPIFEDEGDEPGEGEEPVEGEGDGKLDDALSQDDGKLDDATEATPI